MATCVHDDVPICAGDDKPPSVTVFLFNPNMPVVLTPHAYNAPVDVIPSAAPVLLPETTDQEVFMDVTLFPS
jgi:hypothetical protein